MFGLEFKDTYFVNRNGGRIGITEIEVRQNDLG